MNTLATASMTNPYGKASDCIRFTIDDVATPFVLKNIMIDGQQYTFSLWLMSEADAALSVGGKTFASTNAWCKHFVTFTASGTDLLLNFDVAGTYYVYHPQLEIGNKATDWTPASEDMDEAISSGDAAVREEMVTQHTTIISDCESIILSALENYVATGDYEEFRSTVSTQLEIMAGEISMNFTTTQKQITSVDGELQEWLDQYSKHISFSDNGITIKGGEHQYTLQLDNDAGVVISENGVVKSQLYGDDFYTGNIVIETSERAQFGNFAFVPRSDGSLSFLKVNNRTGFYAVLRGSTMVMYGSYPEVDGTTLCITDISGELDGTTLILGGSS